MALCLGQPGWAGTRRNIHPLTPILIIIFCQLPPSTMIHTILPVQFTCLMVIFHNFSLSPVWCISCSGIIHFILQNDPWSVTWVNAVCYVATYLYCRRADNTGRAIECFQRSVQLNPFLWSSYESLCLIGNSPYCYIVRINTKHDTVRLQQRIVIDVTINFCLRLRNSE